MVIPLGGSYAQRSVSRGAVPAGSTLERALGWAGGRSSGAPVFGSVYLTRSEAEYRKKFGEAAQRLGLGVLAGLRRIYAYAMRSFAKKQTPEQKMLASLAHFAEGE